METLLYSSQNLLVMMDDDKKEVKELAYMLFDLGPKMINEIENAISNNELVEAGDIAHKLKSTLRLWQMNSLVPLAIFIETHGRLQDETTELQKQFHQLKEGLEMAIDEMKKEFE